MEQYKAKTGLLLNFDFFMNLNEFGESVNKTFEGNHSPKITITRPEIGHFKYNGKQVILGMSKIIDEETNKIIAYRTKVLGYKKNIDENRVLSIEKIGKIPKINRINLEKIIRKDHIDDVSLQTPIQISFNNEKTQFKRFSIETDSLDTLKSSTASIYWM
ncbi:MAG: hypothetical protein GON13_01075 [Nanoarchaeota archaeon]|nr:hypothetical protein [Nanoarchaeota archaeon]